MTGTERVQRPSGSRGLFRSLVRRVVLRLWPNQRLRWTREGLIYILIWLGLLAAGLNEQINLILLLAGAAAGPIVGRSLTAIRSILLPHRPWPGPGGPGHVQVRTRFRQA